MARHYMWGVAGSAGILSLYFAILTLSNSLSHAVEELGVIGGWIALLTIGFGIQSGLFSFIREMIKERAGAKATASMAAAGGMGGSSDMGMTGTRSGTDSDRSSMWDEGSMPMMSSGTMNSGDAVIDLRPVRYHDGMMEVAFKANTHSVALENYNFTDHAELEFNGHTYRPVRSDRMRGHHNGGKMIFEVSERPEHFRIIIKGIPGPAERVYEW
ncbi:hypothetical protein BMS3Abin14_00024 [bacterium BMS3Abin14]|nr:hypothetical protein BMS3Abin14_00024 [bacterium BMS3Abin14]